MELAKQKLGKFLNENFNGLKIKRPLFFNWKMGLRFDLQVGKVNTDEYFEEAIRRACTLYQSTFDNDDKVFLILMDYKYKRRKIRFGNFVFKQIENLNITEISYSKEEKLYEADDIYNIAIIEIAANRINYKDILKAISHSDFPPRSPRLDKNGVLTSKEVFFINIDKKIIFNMYDDRGLDIIAADKEILRPIYMKYANWLLDCNKAKIEEQFTNKNVL